jgi:hypothetical protein
MWYKPEDIEETVFEPVDDWQRLYHKRIVRLNYFESRHEPRFAQRGHARNSNTANNPTPTPKFTGTTETGSKHK